MKKLSPITRILSSNFTVKTMPLVCLLGLIANGGCTDKRNILIYTKNGEGYVHDNIQASVDCLKEICNKNNWTCEVSDDPSIFTAEKIKTFDVLIFSNTNNEAFDTDAQKKVFQNYIRNGGAFVGIHSASCSERDWPWFWANVGGKFLRHPPIQPFDIKVIDHNHPSTNFLDPIWKWKDECYFTDHLNPDIHVLLAADLTTIEDDQKDELPGETSGRYLPLCWCHEFDGGRQWQTALGHKIEHYKDANFIKHITGGIIWAMDKSKSAKIPSLHTELTGQKLVIRRGIAEQLSYQAQPLAKPVGGDKFKASNFIHPLKTPSGFTITQAQPEDHLHHFGLWWPWKHVVVDGRKINCWELQEKQGLVQAKRILEHNTSQAGAYFIAESEYIDRTAPSGPQVILYEKLEAQVTNNVDIPANGYFLNLSITQHCTTETPIEIAKYRYSGFTFRGTASWDKDSSLLLTSEGKDRDTSNFTRAKWVLAQGNTPAGGKAGVVLMSRPDNRDFPQLLRTWDSTQTNGSIFVNFNPVQETPWKFEPGKDYKQNYQLFIYDGEVTAEQAEQLWQSYAGTSKIKK